MIFSENPDDFRYGRWVGNLNHELAPSRLREHLKEKRDVDVIPDSNWYRRPRFWRATGEQWLQFERKDLGESTQMTKRVRDSSGAANRLFRRHNPPCTPAITLREASRREWQVQSR